MCFGGTPDVPSVPERQAAKQPSTDVGTVLKDRDSRRRGFAATMLAASNAGPAATTNSITGV
jgi:hypothetical protein